MLTTTRYFKNKVLNDTNKNGQRFLSTWSKINPVDLYSDSDAFLRIGLETRLDILASTYLGNSKYWWMICILNGMKHFWDWKSGDVLRIPTNASRFFSYLQSNINK